MKEFHFSKSLRMDKALRKELSGQFGKITDAPMLKKHVSKSNTIYAVGDVTVSKLLAKKYMPKVSVFDYMTERGRKVFPIISKTYRKPLKAVNKRGELSVSLWNAVRKAVKSGKQIGIRVYGEEDLASLVCVYFAKEGDYVIYGIRNKGMAVVKINKNIKKYVAKVLDRMLKL